VPKLPKFIEKLKYGFWIVRKGILNKILIKYSSCYPITNSGMRDLSEELGRLVSLKKLSLGFSR